METIASNRTIKVGNKIVDCEKYYTPEETERILGVKRITIDRRVKDGSLKRSGAGRIIFYKGEDIIQLLNRNRN